jgi:hypothetical protein
MARRRKLTVFSRFLIVLVILLPLAYIGASLLNGEDPIENVENFWKTITGEEPPEAQLSPQQESPAGPVTDQEPVSGTQDSVPSASKPTEPSEENRATLQQRIQQLEVQQKALREKLDSQEKKIRWLESQVKSMQQ